MNIGSGVAHWTQAATWTRSENLLVPRVKLECKVSTVRCHYNAVRYNMTPHTSPQLTHRGRVTQICVSELTIIDSDNGLSPGRREAILWTNAKIFKILLIRTLGTNFNEIKAKFIYFHVKKCIWKCRLRNSGHFVSASMCQPYRPDGRAMWCLLSI